MRYFITFIFLIFSPSIFGQEYNEIPGVPFNKNPNPWGFEKFGIIDRLDNRIMPEEAYAIFNHNDFEWGGDETEKASHELLKLMKKFGIKTVYHQTFFDYQTGQTQKTAFFKRNEVDFSVFSHAGENKLRYPNMKIGIFSGGQFEHCLAVAMGNTVCSLKKDIAKIYISTEATYVAQGWGSDIIQDQPRIEAGWWDLYKDYENVNPCLKKNKEINRWTYPLQELMDNVGEKLFYEHFKDAVLLGRFQDQADEGTNYLKGLCLDPRKKECNLTFKTFIGDREIGSIGNGIREVHFIFASLDHLNKVLEKEFPAQN